jgi:hypothetical protein
MTSALRTEIGELVGNSSRVTVDEVKVGGVDAIAVRYPMTYAVNPKKLRDLVASFVRVNMHREVVGVSPSIEGSIRVYRYTLGEITNETKSIPVENYKVYEDNTPPVPSKRVVREEDDEIEQVGWPSRFRVALLWLYETMRSIVEFLWRLFNVAKFIIVIVALVALLFGGGAKLAEHPQVQAIGKVWTDFRVWIAGGGNSTTPMPVPPPEVVEKKQDVDRMMEKARRQLDELTNAVGMPSTVDTLNDGDTMRSKDGEQTVTIAAPA